jgi:hypothetical protein
MAVAAVVQIAVTGLLALVVHMSTSKIARLEFGRSLREAWVTVDELALSDASTLKVAETLLEPNPHSTTEDFARKRWFLLAYLNPINTRWQAAQAGIFGRHKGGELQNVRNQLRALLDDEEAYWVTQHHGHEVEFRQLCTEIRDELRAERAAGAKEKR